MKIVGNGGTKLFSLSSNKNEYKKMKRTLSGTNKQSSIRPDMVNESLMKQACKKLKSELEITLIHDPSDIRKPYSRELEAIGRVRDLKGNIINGYSTHNVIALGGSQKDITLVSNVTYSNKSAQFLHQSTIKNIEEGVDFEGKEEAKALYNSGLYYNKKTVSKEQISRCSIELKKHKESLKLTHVLDREFDDDNYLKHIHKLGDDFVIREKKSRCIDTTNESGKKQRLMSSGFDNSDIVKFQKLSIKKLTIQDGKIRLQWSKHKGYTAVKVSILDREDNNVFDEAMLLLTNNQIDNLEHAYGVYREYLKRSKIEYVFKFLKDGLGWEDMRIQDFKSIENIVSLAFYAAAYLYEIGEEYAHDDYAVMLADLGDGKGKVTRHFILQGIHVVMNYCKFELYRKKNKISDESVEKLKNAFVIEF